MNNMRRGFTMIELIFVIVIIGILAAVAIPKMQGVSEQAEVANIKSYAGTLSATTLPGVWSKSLTDGLGGSIKTLTAGITRDLPAPKGVSAPTFAKLEKAGFDFRKNTAPGTAVATETVGGTKYTVVCSDGDKINSPQCDVWNGTLYVNAQNQQ